MNAPLLLGRNAATGRRVFVTPRQRSTHMFVPGRTGTGKTTFLEFLIRQDIRAGNGACVMDPDGELYNKLVTYCAKRPSTWDRVLLVDPNEEAYRVGLNYFDLPGFSPQRKIDFFIEACYKVLGQLDTKIQFDRWGDAAAKPLVLHPDGPLTLAELHPLLTDPEFRNAVLARVPQGKRVLDEWAHFDHVLKAHDQNMALLAVLNRAAKFARDERMEEILGQPNSIDWLDAMNAGKIVLVNLYTGPDVTPDLSRMLGVMVIHQIVAAAMLRPEKPAPKPFYVYVDEFSAVVTEDFRTALKRLRKRGVAFTLAQQDLSDLLLEDEGKLYASVINNTTNKVAFGMENADDAAALARHLFAGETTGTRIKWQGAPITQAVPIARSAEVATMTHGHADAWGEGSGLGDSGSTAFDPDGDELVTTKGVMFGSQSQRMETDTSSVTYSTQRWTDYEYQQIDQAPQFMGIEEELHHYSRRILRQATGEAQLKYDAKKPTIPILTFAPGSREFPEVWASPALVAEFKEAVYRNMHLRRPAEVRGMIEERRRRVLAGDGLVRDSAVAEFEPARKARAQLPPPMPAKKSPAKRRSPRKRSAGD
jgi:hypothetical protein